MTERQEFRIVISGVDFPEEHRARLNSALQQATLHAIADLDFGGDRAAIAIPISRNFPSSFGNDPLGTTLGMWVKPVSTDDLKKLDENE